MAVLASIATGNFTAAATWGVVNAASYLNSESATESLITTAYSGTRSSAFTPGAITISHIGVKLCERIGTTGTISVHLELDAGDVDVADTEVTIDVADLPSALEVDLNGGWVFFKLATPVLLLAATAYQVAVKTSTATMVDLFCDATVDNLSRCLVTTTTQAPGAGDDIIVGGEYTGAGTSNAFVVTMDNTATTDFGAGSNSLVTPAIAICSKGTLRSGIAAATAYLIKVSGNVIVYSGGELDLGTVATPIPRNSTTLLQFDIATNVEFGLTVRNLGTCIPQGLSRTVSKNIWMCFLNTDEAAGQTVLGVDRDTGWLAGDEIAIASTSRSGNQTEIRTLASDATATTLTVTVGLTNAHSGTAPTQAEVVNLTRNVTIRGTSATLQAYVDIKPTAIVDCDWTAFQWLGSATANKRGIDLATTTGSAAFTYCALRNFVVTSSAGFVVAGAASNNYTVQYCAIYAMASSSINNVATTGTNWVLDNIIIMGQTLPGTICNINDVGGTITNIASVGNDSASNAMSISELGAKVGTIGNLTSHSNDGAGITLNGFSGTVTGIKCWRNAGGLDWLNSAVIVIDTAEIFGNLTYNITAGQGYVVCKDFTVSSDTSFTTTSGLTFASGDQGGVVTFQDSTFGVASGIKSAHTRDILPVAYSLTNVTLQNTILASATEVLTQAIMSPGVIFSSSKHDQTAGNHKAWMREGTISSDATIFNIASPSERLTPLIADEKLKDGGKIVPVDNGNTVTVMVKVRESEAGDGAAYNGARVRLIMKGNAAVGLPDDVVLDTATASSDGAWEELSGTTGAVNDYGEIEFYVDCDGTAGWINVDDWATT